MKELMEVVKCKNCKHSENKRVVGNGITEPPYITRLQCNLLKLAPMNEEDYCSYGEEK